MSSTIKMEREDGGPDAYPVPAAAEPVEARELVWWVVTLREDGDDEDSIQLVQALTEDEAVKAAIWQFGQEGEPAGTQVYVNYVVRCGLTKPEVVRSAPV